MPVDFMQHATKDGLTLVLYRGEDMVLLAFDVDDSLKKPDFVGFGIQYRVGNDPKPRDVYNFLTFKALREKAEADNPPAPKPAKTKSKSKKSAPAPAAAPAPAKPVDLTKTSMRSPIQLFRWAHVPSVPVNGKITYIVSAMFFNGDQPPIAKATVEATIDVGSATRGDFLNVGFTRGFASSQAYVRRFQNTPDVLQKKGKHEIDLDPTPFSGPDGPYPWLGFEARRIMLGFLDELIADASVSVDAYAYDLSNPEIVHRLEKLGKRLRIVIDNSANHGRSTSEETRAQKLLEKSTGKANVKRHKFQGLQHNKVFIAKRDGKAFAVLTGSTNFALRGLYIQNNNVLLFRDPDIAGWYADVFAAGFPKGDGFKKNDVATKWFEKKTDNGNFAFAYSPHSDATLSMKRIADAVEAAESSVMYAIAFYGAQTGLAGEAIRAIDTDKIHVMGVADKPGSAKPKKTAGKKKAKGAKTKKDTTTTFVQLPGRGRVPLSPAALAKDLPPPFHAEWPGGSGVRMHHKFVICDFNGRNPVVYTGSSNLATGGEQGNGDNLIEIRDPKVVVAYAVQAVSIFDHYAFRVRMKGLKKKPEAMDLAEPPAAGEEAWWQAAFGGDDGKTHDRELFSTVRV
jgi:phosphatidylserine/phosphatidylglycerophosphate/cardiolipin synthase-like enzyme